MSYFRIWWPGSSVSVLESQNFLDGPEDISQEGRWRGKKLDAY